jgi:FAD/FMN-containing dehydrogenase
MLDTELVKRLKTILGTQGLLEGDAVQLKNYRDLMGAKSCRPHLLLRPENTSEVSAILKACNAAGQAITPQGGMTGLVSAAAPREGELALGFERMRTVEEIDRLACTMTVQAGVELQTIQEQAAAQGLLFPLDLGARGSCTIGGNLSTNAGGNRVIRYGMTRDLVLGLEAVLADGTVINSMNKLRKNNTGYDLKQLFIGSEGTLGVITRAVLKLMPRPTTQAVALCAVHGFGNVTELLLHAQLCLSGNLTAFEVLWQNCYRLIDQHIKAVKVPLGTEHEFYVLIESMGSSAEKDAEQFVNMLDSASRAVLLRDAILADSDKQIANLWRLRDSAAELSSGVGLMHTYDVSLGVSDMGYFGEEVVKRLKNVWPQAVIGLFGHIGDGNLHIVIHVGPNTANEHLHIDEIIYGLVQELQGSVSAEHGIGLMKKPFLAHSRSEEEIALMRQLKKTLDPKGILSPGRIF